LASGLAAGRSDQARTRCRCPSQRRRRTVPCARPRLWPRFWRNRSCARYEWTLRLLRDKPKRAMGLARTDDGHPASGCSRRSSHGWRGVTWIVEKTRALRHRVFLPVAKPAKFLDSEAITEQLQTPDAVLAGELLAYAREIAAAPQ